MVSSWCGHTEGIAEQAYWMTTGEDITLATTLKVSETMGGGAYVVQQPIANGGNGLQDQSSTHEKTPEKPGFAASCKNLQSARVGDEGLEPPTSSL